MPSPCYPPGSCWDGTWGLNVCQFGALGDGTTDDLAAIVAADAAASALNCPLIFAPGRRYRISDTLTRLSQSAWLGIGKQSSYNGHNKTQIYGTAADLGDGQPLIRCAADGIAGQSLVFSGLEFCSDKTVDHSNLSAATSSGVTLVDISHIKNGLEFVGCSFKGAAVACKQGNASPYLDKVTFSLCHFNRLYRAIDASPTAGLSLSNCFLYDCFDFIDSTTGVLLDGCSINNSSFASENSAITGSIIQMIGGWIEGGNRVIQPTKYGLLQGVTCSETYSGSGSTKFLAKPGADGATLEFRGCQIPTNTRLVDLSAATIPTITVLAHGCYGGSNFSDAADITTPIDNGLAYDGAGNAQVAWNVTGGRNAANADYTLALSDRGKVLFHSSSNPHTWTIPADASVPFPLSAQPIIITNEGSGLLTIAITSDTLRRGASTGSFTVAQNEIYALYKIAATTWRACQL